MSIVISHVVKLISACAYYKLGLLELYQHKQLKQHKCYILRYTGALLDYLDFLLSVCILLVKW